MYRLDHCPSIDNRPYSGYIVQTGGIAMDVIVSLKVEDYVYLFYQKGAMILIKRPEELMEEAIFHYAGMIANDLLHNSEYPNE